MPSTSLFVLTTLKRRRVLPRFLDASVSSARRGTCIGWKIGWKGREGKGGEGKGGGDGGGDVCKVKSSQDKERRRDPKTNRPKPKTRQGKPAVFLVLFFGVVTLGACLRAFSLSAIADVCLDRFQETDVSARRRSHKTRPRPDKDREKTREGNAARTWEGVSREASTREEERRESERREDRRREENARQDKTTRQDDKTTRRQDDKTRQDRTGQDKTQHHARLHKTTHTSLHKTRRQAKRRHYLKTRLEDISKK
jgi:hypothetical protein